MHLSEKNEKMQRKLLKRIAVGAGVATLLAGTAAVMWAKHTRRSKFVSEVDKPEQTETQTVEGAWGRIRTIGVVIPKDAPRRNMGEDWPRRRMGDNFAQ